MGVLENLPAYKQYLKDNLVKDFSFHVDSGNILLDEALAPKISDFGLTRASARRSSSTVLTEKIVGTTAYMAPEALRGAISPKSDIFSFGVVRAPPPPPAVRPLPADGALPWAWVELRHEPSDPLFGRCCWKCYPDSRRSTRTANRSSW